MNTVLKIGTDSAIGHDIDRMLEEIFEILVESHEIKQAASWLHIDQKINVAFWVGLPSDNRPKETDVFGAVAGGDGKNIAFFSSTSSRSDMPQY